MNIIVTGNSCVMKKVWVPDVVPYKNTTLTASLFDWAEHPRSSSHCSLVPSYHNDNH